ncbi:pseudouridine synthase [Clostridium mediterraneense]|uniref:pseudouridine synthase n=1 Tax=Clostridium mediterraneense TaxID=1805472 RepID=UPI000831DF0A|nr:pseudouridine synthase [Clostridium mediterraneense]
MERLDKILSNLGYGTRKEIKKVVKQGLVTVNGVVVKDNNMKVNPYEDSIFVGDEEVVYREFIYLIMNKPAGVISATFDNREETVVDLLYPEHQVFEPFPVGRLDKDTVGLLLLTNDGELNHKLISPKSGVNKVYFAHINAEVDESDIKAFENGITIDDGYKCMPAKLKVIENLGDMSKVEVTIQEGKFHQVKRMFEARGKKVEYLRRIKFGNIDIDESLNEGEYRELTQEELDLLCKDF